LKAHLLRDSLLFMCPGCKRSHHVSVNGDPAVCWEWNQSEILPTIKPSILVNRGQLNPTGPVCHSFVTEGRIQFLNDSTHELAGQTVELPDWTENKNG
jgi:hypothetical protein